MEERHLRADEARDLLASGATAGSAGSAGSAGAGVDDSRDPVADLRPGLAAGQPTAFDAIGRSLVATRASAEHMIAGGMALVAQLDAAIACLWLIAPPEHRAALREALGGANAGTPAASPARPADRAPGAPPAAPAPPSRSSGEREKPRTFMDKRDRTDSTQEGTS